MSLPPMLQLLDILQQRLPSLERELEECIELQKRPCTDSIMQASIEGRLFALRQSHRLAKDALERWK